VVTRVATWRVTVNEDCIASGSCLGLAPRRFALGQDGLSHPIIELVEPDDLVLDAAASCPMEAIRVNNGETGEPIEP
jgi:ferredoxin